MPASNDPDPLVQQVLNLTKRGEDEHRTRIGRYNRAYEIYRASKPTINRGRPSDWQSRLRIPYGMQVIHSELVNIARGQPGCKVLPRHPGVSAENARAFELVLNYFAKEDGLALKQPAVVQQGLVFGVTAGKIHWLLKETGKPKKSWQIDPLSGDPIPQTNVEKITLYDGPSFEPWDIYDCWWDPNGRDVDSCAYVVLRSWLSKADVERNSCTVPDEHDWYKCNGLYHNLPALFESGTQGRRDTASAQDRLLGGDTNLRRDKFEVWEIWRDDRVTVIGNRQVLLRDSPNPHWHGQKPVVIASAQPDLFKVQGIPETELLSDIQEALWTLQNMRFDNLHLTVMRGITFREGGVTDPSMLELRPRFKWPVTDHDDVRPFEVQPLPPEAYQEEEALLGHMQLVTGINPYVTGAGGSSGVDQNTATGVATLSEVASRLLSFKRYLLQVGIWDRVFRQWGEDVQQFLDKDVYVRIVGPGGEVDFQRVTPQQVAGEYDFSVEGADQQLSQAQERSDAMQLLQAISQLAQAGLANVQPVLERVGKAFNLDDPEALIPKPQAQPQAAPFPNSQPPAPQAQPGLLNGNMAQQAQAAVMSGRG